MLNKKIPFYATIMGLKNRSVYIPNEIFTRWGGRANMVYWLDRYPIDKFKDLFKSVEITVDGQIRISNVEEFKRLHKEIENVFESEENSAI